MQAGGAQRFPTLNKGDVAEEERTGALRTETGGPVATLARPVVVTAMGGGLTVKVGARQAVATGIRPATPVCSAVLKNWH